MNRIDTERKAVRVAQVVLSDALVRRLDEVAATLTMSRSLLIRQACQRMLDSCESQSPRERDEAAR